MKDAKHDDSDNSSSSDMSLMKDSSAGYRSVGFATTSIDLEAEGEGGREEGGAVLPRMEGESKSSIIMKSQGREGREGGREEGREEYGFLSYFL